METIYNKDETKYTEFIKEFIEKTRSIVEPKTGDIIQYIDQYGNYTHDEQIDEIKDNKAIIRTETCIPLVCTEVDKDENKMIQLKYSLSGRYFDQVDKSALKYAGKRDKIFKTNRNTEFIAKVNVWEYTEKNIYMINGEPYDTEKLNKIGIYHTTLKNSEYKYESRNIIWKNDAELQAWLRTYRAKLFYTSDKNCMTAWYWKEIGHNISPTEFEKLNLQEDTIKIDNNIYKCKRFYDEQKKEIHTYYVWHWKEGCEDRNISDILKRQKETREKYYLTNENLYKLALSEFEKGIAIPITEPTKINIE